MSNEPLSDERIAHVDSLYKTPQERAEEVNSILQIAAKTLGMDHTLFDVTCFSIKWLAMLAIGNLSDDRVFGRIAEEANVWLNNIHYNGAEKIYGEPDKEEVKEEKKTSEYGELIEEE